MDKKMILMIVVAIVLGMLVANMLKDVCGCKNLIEGQGCQVNSQAWISGNKDIEDFPIECKANFIPDRSDRCDGDLGGSDVVMNTDEACDIYCNQDKAIEGDPDSQYGNSGTPGAHSSQCSTCCSWKGHCKNYGTAGVNPCGEGEIFNEGGECSYGNSWGSGDCGNMCCYRDTRGDVQENSLNEEGCITTQNVPRSGYNGLEIEGKWFTAQPKGIARNVWACSGVDTGTALQDEMDGFSNYRASEDFIAMGALTSQIPDRSDAAQNWCQNSCVKPLRNLDGRIARYLGRDEPHPKCDACCQSG